MKLFWISLIGILSTVVFLSSCSDDECPDVLNPDCDNYDPCLDVKPVTADFKMYEIVRDSLVSGDTLLQGTISFKAPVGYDYYEWHIGNDPRTWNDPSFGLLFRREDTGRFEITLIVESTPNTLCFPDDDGRDTLTRYLYLTNRSNSLMPGNYLGYLESDPAHYFMVNIENFGNRKDKYFINNLQEGCFIDSTIRVIETWVGYKALIFGRGLDYSAQYVGNNCNDPRGEVYLQEDNKTIIVSLDSRDPVTEERIFDTFHGVRQ